jgi:tetratricopeptide (TPR) repeat protein
MDNDCLLARQISAHEAEAGRHPGQADLLYRYGVLLRSQGRFAESAQQFAAAVEASPAFVKAVIKLGMSEQDLGRVEEAVATFRRAFDMQAEHTDMHYRLGLLYTNRKQFGEAVNHISQTCEGAKSERQIRAELAMSLQNMGLMDRTAATWRSLRKVCRVKT